MDQVEAREGKEFDYLISHHAFTNAMTAAQIVERRHREGKTKLKHFNFVHGTALKMCIKEKEGDPEYPMRFLTKCQGSGVFSGVASTQGVWVNSEDYIGKFLDCFPLYPKQNCVFSQIGVNQKIFCPRGTEVAPGMHSGRLFCFSCFQTIERSGAAMDWSVFVDIHEHLSTLIIYIPYPFRFLLK